MEELLLKLISQNSPLAIFVVVTVLFVKYVGQMKVELSETKKELQDTKLALARLDVKLIALTEVIGDLKDAISQK